MNAPTETYFPLHIFRFSFYTIAEDLQARSCLLSLNFCGYLVAATVQESSVTDKFSTSHLKIARQSHQVMVERTHGRQPTFRDMY